MPGVGGFANAAAFVFAPFCALFAALEAMPPPHPAKISIDTIRKVSVFMLAFNQ